MSFYKHCTGDKQTSKTVYVVAYVNWLGQWAMDSKELKTEKAAVSHSKKIAKAKAENGRVSIRMVPSSKIERAKLQKNINKF